MEWSRHFAAVSENQYKAKSEIGKNGTDHHRGKTADTFPGYSDYVTAIDSAAELSLRTDAQQDANSPKVRNLLAAVTSCLCAACVGTNNGTPVAHPNNRQKG